MDILSLHKQSKEKSLQSLFLEMTENIRNNANPQHTARELIHAFIVSAAEEEPMANPCKISHCSDGRIGISGVCPGIMEK